MNHFELIAAGLIAVMSVARTARLIIYDDLPPMVWLRERVVARYADDSKWAKLWECPFCMTPYLMVGMFAWAAAALDTDPYDMWSSAWWWFVVNGIWGLCYLSASYVVYDMPED